MSFRTSRKLNVISILVLLFGFSTVGCNNRNTTETEESVLKAVFETFEAVIDLSNNFERFPMNDSYLETQYISMTNSSTVPDNFHQRLTDLLAYYRIGAKCRKDLLQLNNGLENSEDWALRMVDAFGKPVPGLVDLNLKWLGSYDECVNAHNFLEYVLERTTYIQTEDLNFTKSEQHNVKGQYCKLTLPFPLSLVPDSSKYLVEELQPPTVFLGGCFPDTCGESDVSRIITAVADHMQGSDSQFDAIVTCMPKPSLTTGSIVMMVVVSLLGVMLLTGTAYDALVLRMGIFKKDNYASVQQEEPLHLNDVAANGTSEVNGALKGYDANHVDINKEEIEAEKTSGLTDGDKIQKPEGRLHLLLMSLSIIKNGEAVLNTNVSGDRVNAIDGLRTVTMCWIILTHILTFGPSYSDNIDRFLAENKFDWTFSPLMSPLTVDTFFTITGFLVAYLVMKRLHQYGGVRNFPWGLFYLLRFLRISPLAYFVFFVSWFLYPYLSSGPFWQESVILSSSCPQMWWPNLLYIQNFYPLEKLFTCFGQSWYLAADTQCYILSPILIILLYLKPRVGIIVSIVVVALSCLYSGVIVKILQFASSSITVPVTPADIGYYQWIHYLPFSHMGPFIVGMLTGYLLYRCRTATSSCIVIKTHWNICGWCVCLSIILCMLYLPFIGSSTSYFASYNDLIGLFLAVVKSLWSVAVGWIIFACATGQGGFVNDFLSLKPFIVFGRLTFSAYLVHIAVLNYSLSTRRTAFYYTDIELVYFGTSVMVLTYGLGFIFSVCVEVPAACLLKLFFQDMKK